MLSGMILGLLRLLPAKPDSSARVCGEKKPRTAACDPDGVCRASVWEHTAEDRKIFVYIIEQKSAFVNSIRKKTTFRRGMMPYGCGILRERGARRLLT